MMRHYLYMRGRSVPIELSQMENDLLDLFDGIYEEECNANGVFRESCAITVNASDLAQCFGADEDDVIACLHKMRDDYRVLNFSDLERGHDVQLSFSDGVEGLRDWDREAAAEDQEWEAFFNRKTSAKVGPESLPPPLFNEEYV